MKILPAADCALCINELNSIIRRSVCAGSVLLGWAVLPLPGGAPPTPAITTNATIGNSRAAGAVSGPVAFTRSAVADQEWRALQAQLAPAGLGASPTTTVRQTPAQVANERAARADRLFTTARQAKEFYTRYPNDANTARAHKLEVTAALGSARLGKSAVEAPALALAATYRKDKTHLREDRFEVALAADRFQLRKAIGDKTVRERPQDHEKLADTLFREFGAIPEVFGLYAGIAAEADMHSANRIATKILEMCPPPFAKAAAQAITSRYGLLGRPLGLRLTSIDGQAFELPSTPAIAATTVLYVWPRPTGPSSNPFAALAAPELKGAGRADLRWIYLGLGVTPAEVATAKAKAPYSGTHCVDSAGRRSAAAQRLKVQSEPMVFVLNARGVLTGFGSVNELPALLAATNR